REGKVLCVSNYPGCERDVAVTPEDSCKHIYLVGRTGSGKSVVLTHLAEQDMAAGRGLVLIDPKGELFERVLDRVPEHRVDDVILMDVSDTDYPVGFNILSGQPSVAAADIQRLFEHLYPNDSRSVRVRQGMYHAVMTLMTSRNATAPMTFADVIPLCNPRANQVAFSDNLIRGIVDDEELAAFWQELENLGVEQRSQQFGPLLSRVWQLNGRRSLRNIIGQSKSGFSMRDVVRDRKILLINLGRRTEGADTAGLVGSLLVSSLWSEIRAGGANPDNPVSLILDEFQDFLNLPTAPQEMLAQARSDGLSVVMAHQYFGQLKNTNLQDAVISNAVSKVVFGCGPDDARTFARVFGKSVDENHLMSLSQWEVTCQVAIGGAVSSPITGFTRDLSRPTGTASKVRQLSRQKYARPVAEVEAEIKQRRTMDIPPQTETKRRPRRGAMADEVEPIRKGALDVVTLKLYEGDGTEPETIVMEVDAFDKLASGMDMGDVLRRATPAYGPRRKKASTTGTAAAQSTEKIYYSDIDHAGTPHRGRITEAEKDTVRNNLDDINERLQRNGIRIIDLDNAEHVQRYGLEALAKEAGHFQQ
ncbi:MAG: type IV secretion system DNA-binding domain-containing protein, partial [Acidobacteria bacterium]|nr:type IV secretion system DNA-binding domain-containing protein [Acidobacteriota bacterium]